VVALMHGDKMHGYQFMGSHAHPNVFIRRFQLLSRIVPNDGNWKEVDPQMFNVASAFHSTGHVVELLADRSGKEFPVISKY